MSRNDNTKQKLRISFKAGLRESLGILLCFLLVLVLPIASYEYWRTMRPANSETYTEEALQDAQSGQVAGVNTINAATDSKYFTIPVLNFKFDTTLGETPSIIMLFGGMLLVGGIIYTIVLIYESAREVNIPDHTQSSQ